MVLRQLPQDRRRIILLNKFFILDCISELIFQKVATEIEFLANFS